MVCRRPPSGARASPTLGGEDQADRVRVEGLADQGIGADGAVVAGVEGGGVDVVDAELDGAPQDGAAGFGSRAGPVNPVADSRMAPTPSRKVRESMVMVSP